MSVKIEVKNAVSRVYADEATIRELRHLVSYRDVKLPPSRVQFAIKSFLDTRSRWYGYEVDHADMIHDPVWAEALKRGGRPNGVSRAEWENTLRNRNLKWDGWTPLVSQSGSFGTGLVNHVLRALWLRLRLEATVHDQRVQPRLNPLPFTMSLYDYQREAVDAWLSEGGRGVFDLPPRSGKTRCAIEAVRRTGLPTLVVVPKRVLVGQTVDRFREFMPADQVIGLEGGASAMTRKKRVAMNRALVWIAVYKTAGGRKISKRKYEPMAGMDSRRLLIIDEFHHAAAKTYHRISRHAHNAYFRLGLTGTHYRADGKDLAMAAILARAVYSRSVSDMVDLGRLVPAKVAMVRVPDAGDAPGLDERVYSWAVVNHEWRNWLAARAAIMLQRHGKRVLILVKEVDHATQLAAMIPGAKAVDGDKRKADVAPSLEAMRSGKLRCLVGTSVIGEGVDIPAADALVYAAAGRSKVKVVQDYFRVLTASKGKDQGLVIDFADLHHEGMTRQSAHRMALYRSEKAFDAEFISHDALDDWIIKNSR